MAITSKKHSADSAASSTFDGTERFLGLQGSPLNNVLFTLAQLHTLPTFTVGTVPAAASFPRRLIHVSDGDAGNPCIAISDGTDWKRIVIGATIATM